MWRRLLSYSSKRRKFFQFEPLEHDAKVIVTTEPTGCVEIPLESHPIGSYGPSLIPFAEGLLAVLACPISGGELRFDQKRNLLLSQTARVAFPINNAGMPLFLTKWAIPLKDLK